MECYTQSNKQKIENICKKQYIKFKMELYLQVLNLFLVAQESITNFTIKKTTKIIQKILDIWFRLYNRNYQHMKKIVIVLGLLLLANSLYTSRYWTKKGFNVKDGKIQQTTDSITVNTVCNQVNLSGKPYNHNGTVMSGYLNVGKGGSALGFIFYGRENTARSDLTKYPIILWLNGGPGSSSQLGNFMELGPYFVKPAAMAPYEIVRNNHTWVKDYNVIFVDQPVGTGLSYADPSFANAYCKSMEDVATDFWKALYELYQTSNGCFNKLGLSPSQDLIIFGESYGGKYAPAIADRIKRQQQDHGGFLTGLKGVAIGDGFTHPYTILSEVGEYAYNLGLLDYQERSKVQQMIMNATFQDRTRAWRDLHDSFDNVLEYIIDKAGGVNVYDITKYHDYPDILIQEYLDNPEIKKLFSLNPEIDFGAQSDKVYEAMYEDFMKPYVQLVEDLLRRNVHILIYNGQNDLIVETPGTFKWVERIHYEDAPKFRDTYFSVWKTNGKTSGYKKQAGHLQLRTINNAGHLVPMDQGEASLNMVNTFVKKCTGRGDGVKDQ